MINKTVDLSSIQYENIPAPGNLIASIRERGIAIPVKVNVTDGGFVCIDGNKRLSAAAILATEDSKFRNIPVMIANDFSKAGSAYWGNTRNRH